VEVRTSRAKAAVVAVVSGLLGGLLVVAAQSVTVAWVGVGFCALGFLAGGSRVLRPTTMFRLEDRELVVAGGIRGRPSVRWNQVKSVEVRDRRALRGSVVTLTIRDGRQTRRMELSDTWLDTSADALAREIVARANAAPISGE